LQVLLGRARRIAALLQDRVNGAAPQPLQVINERIDGPAHETSRESHHRVISCTGAMRCSPLPRPGAAQCCRSIYALQSGKVQGLEFQTFCLTFSKCMRAAAGQRAVAAAVAVGGAIKFHCQRSNL